MPAADCPGQWRDIPGRRAGDCRRLRRAARLDPVSGRRGIPGGRMKIVSPLLAVLLAALSVVAVRQGRRAWRDPDWEPGSGSQSPRSVVALAVLMVSFAVLLAGASVLANVPGTGWKEAGAGLAAAGFVAITFAAISMETTKRFGRPRFLIPPARRPGYERAAPGFRRADHRRDSGSQRSAGTCGGPGGRLVVQYGGRCRGLGSRQRVHRDRRTGKPPGRSGQRRRRLTLTTSRLLLSTRRPNLSGQSRSWPVADLHAVVAGPVRTQ